ncbi:MAG: methylated-DNA--[protein]-cysteine S-methyltransferase [Kiritimatiellia bacterium]|jgi:methylated-DNA-[protein]-cysteine S-methyltransferase
MNPCATSSTRSSDPLLRCAACTTPLGRFTLAQAGEAIVRVWLPGEAPGQGCHATTPLLEKAFQELDDYLAGNRKRFSIPLAPSGTPFQRAVWRAIDAIPYADTATYADIAARIGRPTAVRAVANACGRNPLAVFTPCHRVVAAKGLGGFRGGIMLKQALLNLERRWALPDLVDIISRSRTRSRCRCFGKSGRSDGLDGSMPHGMSSPEPWLLVTRD